MDDASLRLNFSFVLREPSTSKAVHQAARDSRRFSRRRPELVRRFSSMTHEELASRVVIHPSLCAFEASGEKVTGIITTSLGLPELVPRALKLVAPDTLRVRDPEVCVIDCDEPVAGRLSVTFFNAPATLNLPESFPPDSRFVVAGLIVRPGQQNLMLIGQDLNFNSCGGYTDSMPLLITQALEDVVRDFLNQWTPARPLWDAPVETMIPESRNRFPNAEGT